MTLSRKVTTYDPGGSDKTMRRYKPPPDLIKFLKPYNPAVQQLALSLRSLLLEEMAPCHENIYDAYSAVAIGYGPTDRLKDGVLHIAVYARHVNLGFNQGDSDHARQVSFTSAGNRPGDAQYHLRRDNRRAELQ